VATVKSLCLAISSPRSQVSERSKVVGSLRTFRCSVVPLPVVLLGEARVLFSYWDSLPGFSLQHPRRRHRQGRCPGEDNNAQLFAQTCTLRITHMDDLELSTDDKRDLAAPDRCDRTLK
jgi:hypothetical protein